MNTAKIAALYADPIFNTLLRFPTFDPTTNLTKQVMAHVLRKARAMSKGEDGRHYEASASNPLRRERYTYTDDEGDRAVGFLTEDITTRAANWMLSQMPGWPSEPVTRQHQDLADHDVFLVAVMGYGRHAESAEHDIETRAGYYFGSETDLQILMRGLASIRRKRRKQAKKLEAQLRAYHAQQELTKLRRGNWLGAEKAITTAARVDAQGVPFMGDTSLTSKQRQEMGMHYYAVDSEVHGMPAAFPVGTGMALLPVNRSRQLVDGAVYFWRWKVNGEYVAQMLGRLDMSAKERGHLPLRFEDGSIPGYCWAAYGDSATEKGIELWRVTHYTTRGAESVTEAAAVPLHQPKLRGQRRARRELQAA